MPLTLYRRHTSACDKQYSPYDRSGRDCRCMIQVEGALGGEFVRTSTRTRAWSRAEAALKKAERLGRWVAVEGSDDSGPAVHAPTVQVAVDSYLARLKSKSGRNLLDPTVSKHRTTVQRLADFASAEGLSSIDQINFDVLDRFRSEWDAWNIGPQTAANYIVRLRKMGKFFVQKEWWLKNHALDLEYPEDYERTERQPYTDQEMEAILKAARTVKLNVQQETTNWELETIILLMRYTGMAIIDAALLQDREIVGDQLVYYRRKTRRSKHRIKVVFPLPDFLLERLRQIKRQGLHQSRYYFCRGSEQNATDVWHKRLSLVFKAAKIENGESHRFRHTFATYWLSTKIQFPTGEWGYTPLSVVSRWLGHASEATTRRYYSHWIKQREDEASDIARTHHRLQHA
jgi:integrase